MPPFADVAAHLVIDTLLLLMWHQTLFTRLTSEVPCPPHLKALVDYYLRQCQPWPLCQFVRSSLFRTPEISCPYDVLNDNLA